MRQRIREIRERVVARASEVFTATVRAAVNPEQAAAQARRVRQEYPGLPLDALADVLIKRAARKTKWEGAANGLGVTGFEAVVVAPTPEPVTKAAAAAGVAALVLGEIAWVTRVQIQLILAIADLYGCPFEREDEEDAYTVFMAALGLKGTERAGSYARFIFTETARTQFRRLLRTGVRRAIQDRIIRVAGERIGRYLGEKAVMRLVPVANAAIGYAFNNHVTKSVGRWAKVKAKVRSSAFKQVALIHKEEPSALLWVLPVIFYIGTADERLTDNVLTLYSQTSKRLTLSEEERRRLEELIDDEDLPQILEEELPRISSARARRALYDVALTTAAINLQPGSEHKHCVAHVATCLTIEHSDAHLDERVRYLRR